MASGSRGRGSRAHARAGAPAALLDAQLASLPAGDLIAHLNKNRTRGSEFVRVALVLDARERRLAEAEARIRASDEVACSLRDEIRARERSAAEAEAEIRRAAETEARLQAEIRALERRAAEAEAAREDRPCFEPEIRKRDRTASEIEGEAEIGAEHCTASEVEGLEATLAEVGNVPRSRQLRRIAASPTPALRTELLDEGAEVGVVNFADLSSHHEEQSDNEDSDEEEVEDTIMELVAEFDDMRRKFDALHSCRLPSPPSPCGPLTSMLSLPAPAPPAEKHHFEEGRSEEASEVVSCKRKEPAAASEDKATDADEDTITRGKRLKKFNLRGGGCPAVESESESNKESLAVLSQRNELRQTSPEIRDASEARTEKRMGGNKPEETRTSALAQERRTSPRKLGHGDIGSMSGDGESESDYHVTPANEPLGNDMPETSPETGDGLETRAQQGEGEHDPEDPKTTLLALEWGTGGKLEGIDGDMSMAEKSGSEYPVPLDIVRPGNDLERRTDSDAEHGDIGSMSSDGESESDYHVTPANKPLGNDMLESSPEIGDGLETRTQQGEGEHDPEDPNMTLLALEWGIGGKLEGRDKDMSMAKESGSEYPVPLDIVRPGNDLLNTSPDNGLEARTNQRVGRQEPVVPARATNTPHKKGMYYKMVFGALKEKEMERTSKKAATAAASHRNFRCWLYAPLPSDSVVMEEGPDPEAPQK